MPVGTRVVRGVTALDGPEDYAGSGWCAGSGWRFARPVTGPVRGSLVVGGCRVGRQPGERVTNRRGLPGEQLGGLGAVEDNQFDTHPQGRRPGTGHGSVRRPIRGRRGVVAAIFRDQIVVAATVRDRGRVAATTIGRDHVSRMVATDRIGVAVGHRDQPPPVAPHPPAGPNGAVVVATSCPGRSGGRRGIGGSIARVVATGPRPAGWVAPAGPTRERPAMAATTGRCRSWSWSWWWWCRPVSRAVAVGRDVSPRPTIGSVAPVGCRATAHGSVEGRSVGCGTWSRETVIRVGGSPPGGSCSHPQKAPHPPCPARPSAGRHPTAPNRGRYCWVTTPNRYFRPHNGH